MTDPVSRIAAVEGAGVAVRGDDIDTDRIIPARYLVTVTFDGLEEHVFEDDRAQARGAGGVHPFDDPRFAGSTVLVVGRNFGCGSSREHAPQAIHRWGIRLVVGESFSDIFFGNAAVIGLPCVTAAHADLEALMGHVERHPETAIQVDLDALLCVSPAGRMAVAMPPNIRDAFLTGAWDTTGMLLAEFDQVRAVAARLPYIDGFAAPSA